MKHYLLVLYIFLLGISFAQTPSLKAYSDYKIYYSPQDGNYIEIQLQILGNSITHKQQDQGIQGEIGIEYIIKQNDKIILSDAYRLLSPLIKDSTIEDFYEIKRFALKEGEYDLQIKLWDLNTQTSEVTTTKKIKINSHNQICFISDIQVCESIKKNQTESIFTKSGYDVIPHIGNYFPSECNYLPIYFEIYNAINDTTSQLELIQQLYSIDTKEQMNEFNKKTVIDNKSVIPIINNIDLRSLTTGKYSLRYIILKNGVEQYRTNYIFDRTNETLNIININNIIIDPAFQASVSEDSLSFFIGSLLPITKSGEQANILSLIKENNNYKLRKYLQSYWIVSSGKINAYDSWINYKKQVLLVQKLYKTNFMKGYETDRGRVYLQYGPPSAIAIRETSPSEYPYEVWQYDKIKTFSNKRFIFYNPDLVNNNYRLLHSDMIGELKNFRWQSVLTKRNSPNRDIDDPNDGNIDHYGGESQDVFKQF